MSYDWSIAENELFTQRFGSMGIAEMRKVLFAVYSSAHSSGLGSTDYEIGRALGLTVQQVKNLRVGANLLLDGQEQTVERVRECLKQSFRQSLFEYQRQKNRIALQVSDPVVLNYLVASLERDGVFREYDASNGHISVPVEHFGEFLELAFPDIDVEGAESAFLDKTPEFSKAEERKGDSWLAKLARWLPLVENGTAIVGNLIQAFGPVIGI